MLQHKLSCNGSGVASRSRAPAAFSCATPLRRWARPQTAAAHSSRSAQQVQQSRTTPEPLSLADLPLSTELFRLASAKHISLQSALLWAGCAALVFTAGEAHAADALHAAPQYDLAESEDFWSNVVRYGRFFITVMLGTTSVMLKQFAGLFKKPVTAVVAIVSLVGGVVLLKVTLEAMLGMSDPLDYLPVDSTSY